MTLILASSSAYRRKLLQDAGLAPLIYKPNVDETLIKNQMSKASPLEVAQKLAFLKSENVYLNLKSKKVSVQTTNQTQVPINYADQVSAPDGKKPKDFLAEPFVIIGSDQVCVFNHQIFDKPGNFDKNFEHLKKLQGQTHSLLTCVCLLYKNEASQDLQKIEFFNRTDLKMKPLSDGAIKDYLEKDTPFDCAGGYKFESLGHILMEKVTTTDETSIQGLPMIETLKQLKRIEFFQT